MKHTYLLFFALFAVLSFPAKGQNPVNYDTLLFAQQQAKKDAFLAEILKRKAEEQNNKDQNTVKTTASLPVDWKPRGPKALSEGFKDFHFDLNDPSEKKAWLGTYSGLWYNKDVLADSSWHEVESVKEGVFSIAQNPVNPLEMVISTFGNFYISIDGGETWNFHESSYSFYLKYNPQGELYSCSFEPFNSLFNTVYKFNRSTYEFETFIDIQATFWQDSDPIATSLAFDHDGLIYVGLASGKIYRSSSSTGGSWSNIMTLSLSNQSQYTEIAIGKDSNNNKILYALNTKAPYNQNSINWIRKSNDGGNTWVNLSIPLFSGVHFNFRGNVSFHVDKDDPNKFAMFSGSLVYSINGGSSWFTNPNFIIYSYDNHLSVSSTGTAVASGEQDIELIAGLFSGSEISSSDRRKDLNTAFVYDLDFPNNFNDSLLFTHGSNLRPWAFGGIDYLEPINSFPQYYGYGSKKYTDKNEPELAFFSDPSLKFFDREGNFDDHNVDLGNSYGPLAYDEINNVIYGYRFSSEINNQTVFFKVLDVGSGKERIENILVNKYFNYPNIYSSSGNEFLIQNYSEEETNHLYRISVLPDNTGTYEEIGLPNLYFNQLNVCRDNPQIIFGGSYGSLHFSLNGGETWQHKTQNLNAYNLYYAFEPANLNKVFVSISDGVFFTNNFLSQSPIWNEITGNFPGNERNRIWYRESDGRLLVSTYYSGLYSTDYFRSSVADSIIFAKYPSSLCVNEPLKVTFYRNGAFSEHNSYELWLSDANGNFSNATKIGTSETSPIYGQIPNSAISGTGYRLRIISTNTAVPIIHADSEPIEINQGSSLFLPGYPQAINETNNGFVLNAPVSQNAEVWYVAVPSGNPTPTLEQFITGIDSSGLSYLVADSSLALANESNPIIVTGLLAGTQYDLYVATKLPGETCFSSMSKLTVQTAGNPVSYCIPSHTNGCSSDTYISEVGVYNYPTYSSLILNSFNSGWSGGAYSLNSDKVESIIGGILDKILFLQIHDFQGTFPKRRMAAWIDLNDDGDFEDDYETLSNTSIEYNSPQLNLSVPANTPPGIKRLRLRVTDETEIETGTDMTSCGTYITGETEDYLINVETNDPFIFANLDKEQVGQCEIIKVVMEVTGSYNVDNLFRVELSDSTGNFADSTVLLSGLSAIFPVNIQVPHGIPSGDHYKLRVVSTDPVAVSYESADFKISPAVYAVSATLPEGLNEISGKGSIVSTENLNSSSRTSYKAWNSVILQPDFIASPSSGGAFKAEIVGCNPN
ncbi:GEVED domain-containing protein [Jiulongibacter sediminis]|uniref:GEVED domain-containing protein n=1 Tax=Jiulongibacter sediminis TaxID=1605367 RepID=A0A0P7BUC9_9BACT|nr:GEVED domain-containing protein [Jiulongibacter sediminis]KPM48346.1 hypothetical protein AFM12_06780 [Jiulongibacter sediminis]TBX24883.1 hypothetical protein TK44_06785 [Jiulongibacter sediminis]